METPQSRSGGTAGGARHVTSSSSSAVRRHNNSGAAPAPSNNGKSSPHHGGIPLGGSPRGTPMTGQAQQQQQSPPPQLVSPFLSPPAPPALLPPWQHLGSEGNLQSAGSGSITRPSLSSQASAEALSNYRHLSLSRESVRSALDCINHFCALRDSAGPAFVDPRNLTKVGELGTGAYATVEHCRLANWRDPSTHGASSAAIAAMLAAGDAVELEGDGEANAAADDTAYGGVRRGRRAAAAKRRHPAELDVAVKYLRAQLFGCATDLEDFVREAVLLAGLQHPSIVGVLGLGFTAAAGAGGAVAQESMFMVTELCDGGTLRDKVMQQVVKPRKAVYTYAQALQWCVEVADGLAFLHAQQPLIIHRDVKLENVLLCSGEDGAWHAKLADFGLHATAEALDRGSLSVRMRQLVAAEAEAEVRHAAEDATAADANGGNGTAAASDVPGTPGGTSGGGTPKLGRRKAGLRRSTSNEDPKRTPQQGPRSSVEMLRGGSTSGGGVFRKVRSLVSRSRNSSGVGGGVPSAAALAAKNLTGQTGSFLGMAPEVTLGKHYDQLADVFSLGCLIFDVLGKRLTSAEVAFHGTSTEFQTYAMRVAYGYRRPHPETWPQQLSSLVASCLAQRPVDRPPAAEVADRLRALAHDVAAMDARRSGGCSCLG